MDGKSPWLKIHMPDGGLYTLSQWTIDEERNTISGRGSHLDFRRVEVATGMFTVGMDSVSILESNEVQTSGAAAGLTVLTIVSAAVGLYCLTNPKACFGSCPTFYLPDQQGEPRLMAEGFSASVAPRLEATDLDALFVSGPARGNVTVTMTNEALETHVVRRVDLLAVPQTAGKRVLAAQDGTWWEASHITPADRSRGPEGDCSALLSACDLDERTSLADSLYLGAKEVVELEFSAPPSGPLGLIVASRHSLLSTYLFYQGLAYLGEAAAPSLARVSGSCETDAGSNAMGDMLGRIEVQAPQSDGTWLTVGSVGETGPLAVNVHMLRLPPSAVEGPVRLRLRLTKGNWRLDYVALAALEQPVEPRRIPPVAILRDGFDDSEALAALTDPAKTLVTFPGDRYELVYPLPEVDGDWEIFLESRGYYLEWMRQEWLAEEDPAMAALMFKRPRLALGYLAPLFKELEPGMEAHFWGSRYAP